MNYSNHSPWIEALEASQVFPKAEGVITTDISIIGGGIAGIATAYHILSLTDVSVSLIEAKKIAHGATGHNAGQVVLYFEKPFQEIVSEYGLECAVRGQKALLDGWDTLQDMVAKFKMEEDFEICEGYMGVRSIDQLVQHLENKYLRDSGGAQFDGIFIDKNWSLRDQIPEHFTDLCIMVETDFITEKLQTSEYFPVMMTSKKACINSALFCQKGLQYMIEHFHERLNVYEDSPVREIRLLPEQKNQIKGENYTMQTTDIILCTNGFENFHIIDLYQADALSTDHSFHKNISGLIGYMAGFLTPHKKASAISYFPDEDKTDWKSEKYFYVTGRTFTNKTEKQTLICTGGPDSLMTHDGHYEATMHDPHESYEEIKGFLKKYRHEKVPENFPYTWHGLMGYTKTGLRYIGQDSQTPHLWYNLGCNGVGIISSVYGGWKIAKTLSGTSFPRSIFDPQ